MIEKGYTMSKNGKLFNPRGKEIKGSVDKYKYRKTNQRTHENKFMPIKFHKIQGYLKFGEKMFENGMQIRHLDGNHENNSWDNIEIGTNQENQLDIPVENRILRSSNPKHNHAEIIADYKEGMTYQELMLKHNIKHRSTIDFILNKSLTSQNKTAVITGTLK